MSEDQRPVSMDGVLRAPRRAPIPHAQLAEMDVRVREDVADDVVRQLRDAIQVHESAPQLEPLAVVPEWPRPVQRPLSRPTPQVRIARAPWTQQWMRTSWALTPWILGALVVISGLLYVSGSGLQTKRAVMKDGGAAISHLTEARNDLEQLDIAGAREQLLLAQTRFASASSELNSYGLGFLGILARVPGFGALRAGRDLLAIGTHLTNAGAAMGNVIDVFAKSGALLDGRSDDRASFGEVFAPLRVAVRSARQEMQAALALASGIKVDTVPEQYRTQFAELQEKLPGVSGMIDDVEGVIEFMAGVTGTDQPRRYLLLFTNSSELRPTGGFPGSYALLTFEHGRLKDIRADDVYNPDGQIKNLIAPPQQLQHITPGWGMRDAAWWADYPTSAAKTMQLYQRGGGTAVDGVISIQPSVLADMLQVLGPIALPERNLTLTAENVLAELQREVEYGIDKKQGAPKQVIIDLAPMLLQRIATLPSHQWSAMLEVFRHAMATRSALLYFADSKLEQFVANRKWDGSVVRTPGDYLQVNVANIKGAKSDAVTDTSLKLESWLADGTMGHRLTITRQHAGGESEYGFYNKKNPSWVRVLVPKGSVLRGITGNARPSYRPLVSDVAQYAERDADLTALEATYQYDAGRGVTTFEESGYTAFGFWTEVDPGEATTVQLEYAIPAQYAASNYQLYVQRQPGMRIRDFEFTLQSTSGMRIESSTPQLVQWPDSWRLHNALNTDFQLSVLLR